MASPPSAPPHRGPRTITPASVILVCVAALLAIGLAPRAAVAEAASGCSFAER